MANFVSHIRWNLPAQQKALVVPQPGGVSREVSFLSLRERVEKMQAALMISGVKKETRVFIATAPDVDFFVVLLAVMSLGAIAILVERGFGPRRLQSCFRRVRPDVIVGSPVNLLKLRLIPASWPSRRVSVDHLLGVQTESKSGWSSVDDDDTALITFTSGSTAMPRGVNRTHGTLIHQHWALSEAIPGESPQVHLTGFPVVSLHNLCCGYTTVLADANHANVAATDPRALANQISNHKVTSISGAPSLYQVMVQYAESTGRVFDQITQVIIGGAPVEVDLARRMTAAFPAATITILYGSSEAEPISKLDIREYLDLWSQKETVQGGYCVGNTVDGVMIKLISPCDGIIDIDQTPEVEKFMVGEILVSGKHVTASYFEDPESDRQNKTKDRENRLWHRTGDVGYRDNENRLWLAGRKSQIVTTGNQMIYPLIIESFVNQLAGVRKSALGTGPDGCPVLWVVAEDRSALEVVRAEIDRRRWDISTVCPIESIPVDARHQSKTDYTALKKMTKGAHHG